MEAQAAEKLDKNDRAAWKELMRNNPLPAIMGRACYHPCQDACNRAKLDEAVNIHAVERFLGDLAILERWTVVPSAPASGKKVLVIGAARAGSRRPTISDASATTLPSTRRVRCRVA